jgi:hypothetical protein
MSRRHRIAPPIIPGARGAIDPPLSARLRAYVHRVGERAALDALEVHPFTLSRVAAELPVQRGTLVVVGVALKRQEVPAQALAPTGT